jgi:anti-anti-sigma factor
MTVPRQTRRKTEVGDADSIVISMSGELDMARECELLNLVVTLNPLPDTIVELDLSNVTFVDSSGLRSIVNAQAYLRGRCCQLHLVRPQHQLVRLIEMIGLTDLIVVDDSTTHLPGPRTQLRWA